MLAKNELEKMNIEMPKNANKEPMIKELFLPYRSAKYPDGISNITSVAAKADSNVKISFIENPKSLRNGTKIGMKKINSFKEQPAYNFQMLEWIGLGIIYSVSTGTPPSGVPSKYLAGRVS